MGHGHELERGISHGCEFERGMVDLWLVGHVSLYVEDEAFRG